MDILETISAFCLRLLSRVDDERFMELPSFWTRALLWIPSGVLLIGTMASADPSDVQGAVDSINSQSQLPGLLGGAYTNCNTDSVYGLPVFRKGWHDAYADFLRDPAYPGTVPNFVEWAKSNLKPSRMRNICPKWPSLNDEEKTQGVIDIIYAMGQTESGNQPYQMFLETALKDIDSVTKLKQVSAGTLQQSHGDRNYKGCPFVYGAKDGAEGIEEKEKYRIDYDRLIDLWNSTKNTKKPKRTIEATQKDLSILNPYLGFSCALVKFKVLLKRNPTWTFESANSLSWSVLKHKKSDIYALMKKKRSPCFFGGSQEQEVSPPREEQQHQPPVRVKAEPAASVAEQEALDYSKTHALQGYYIEDIASVVRQHYGLSWSTHQVADKLRQAGVEPLFHGEEAQAWIKKYIIDQSAPPEQLAESMTAYQVEGHAWTSEQVVNLAERLRSSGGSSRSAASTGISSKTRNAIIKDVIYLREKKRWSDSRIIADIAKRWGKSPSDVAELLRSVR
jgi:hypothetical protein